MPSAALHSQYWAGSGGGPAPPQTGASAAGGYVPWQTTVIIGMGGGVFQALWERLWHWRRAAHADRRMGT